MDAMQYTDARRYIISYPPTHTPTHTYTHHSYYDHDVMTDLT